MKRIIVFGAGHVAGPLVDYLLRRDHKVTVASRTLSKAERLVEERRRGSAQQFNVKDKDELEELIAENDLAVSLLPYVFHADVAEACIKNGKDMVTTSYVSDEMLELEDRAEDKDILIMMECGLDPGIDHMSAMKIIHDVEDKGGRVKSFKSYCGGLPAPEDNDNPFGYKFSWSPKGVLLAGKNAARYLEDGERIEISGKDLFENHWPMEIPGLPELEAYPNRDSFPYMDKYGLNDAETVFRGTLRYPGWCRTMKCMVDLGLLEEEERDLSGLTHSDLMRDLTDADDELKESTAEYLGIPIDSEPIERLEWLGLFKDEEIPIDEGGPIDALVEKMQDELQYKDGEKDMIVLHHIFEVDYPSKKERITSTLTAYGIVGKETSMAKTVGLPAAIAADMVLDGKIEGKGVHIPTDEDIYRPILERLEEEGIAFQERRAEL